MPQVLPQLGAVFIPIRHGEARGSCFALACRLELPFDESSLYRIAFERVFEASFCIHSCGDSNLNSRITLPIFLKTRQIYFEAGLFRALLIEMNLDRLVEPLIYWPHFELAAVLRGGPVNGARRVGWPSNGSRRKMRGISSCAMLCGH